MVFPCFKMQDRQVAVEYFRFTSEEVILLYLDLEKSHFSTRSVQMKLCFLKHSSGCRPQVLTLEAKLNLHLDVLQVCHELIAFFMEKEKSFPSHNICFFHDETERTPSEMAKVIMQQRKGFTISSLRLAEEHVKGKKSSNSSSNISSDRNTLYISVGKKKLKVRSCKSKNSRTAFKRIDLRKVSASAFRKVFRSYSLLGGRLKSGSVITRSNSNHWLMNAGITRERDNMRFADQLFKDIAGCKVVLNIFDYIKFLNILCRQKSLVLAELLQELMVPFSSPCVRCLTI